MEHGFPIPKTMELPQKSTQFFFNIHFIIYKYSMHQSTLNVTLLYLQYSLSQCYWETVVPLLFLRNVFTLLSFGSLCPQIPFSLLESDRVVLCLYLDHRLCSKNYYYFFWYFNTHFPISFKFKWRSKYLCSVVVLRQSEISKAISR